MKFNVFSLSFFLINLSFPFFSLSLSPPTLRLLSTKCTCTRASSFLSFFLPNSIFCIFTFHSFLFVSCCWCLISSVFIRISVNDFVFAFRNIAIRIGHMRASIFPFSLYCNVLLRWILMADLVKKKDPSSRSFNLYRCATEFSVYRLDESASSQTDNRIHLRMDWMLRLKRIELCGRHVAHGDKRWRKAECNTCRVLSSFTTKIIFYFLEFIDLCCAHALNSKLPFS